MLAAFAVAASSAAAPVLLVGSEASRTGKIDAFLTGAPGAAVDVSERVAGRRLPLATTVIGANGGRTLRGVARWRCDRQVRHLVASTRLGDGTTRSAYTKARTPSCRGRVAVRVARTARPGGTVRVRLRDRWGLGDLRGSLCRAAPGSRLRCRRLAVPRNRAARRLRLGRRRGRWRVELRTRWQRATRSVYVGVAPPPARRHRLPGLLATGDSMVVKLLSFLDDRLLGRAAVTRDVHPSTGLAKPGFDWLGTARRITARLRQRATVVFMGGNDYFPMTTPEGARVPCCNPTWVSEYARRARRLMRIYGRGGRGYVLWLALPAPRQRELAPAWAAVDQAARRAASSLRRVRVLALDDLFTPGFRYRDKMPVNGRELTVRSRDGKHLSLEGAAIAVRLVLRALRQGGFP